MKLIVHICLIHLSSFYETIFNFVFEIDGFMDRWFSEVLRPSPGNDIYCLGMYGTIFFYR